MPPQDDPAAPTPPALPRGGGATRGLGEKFAVQGYTGRGSLSFAVPVTPGRAGFSPALSLSYDSGAGNGLFGLGWRLSIASIFRKSDLGTPRYLNDGDKADTFLHAGTEDLVPLLEQNGSPRKLSDGGLDVVAFRPRLEGSYSRIELRTDPASKRTHWVVTTRDNVTHVFGRSPECCIADPANPDPSRVFEWLLEESFDDRGNVIAYQYKSEDTSGVSRDAAAAPWEQPRLDGSAKFANKHIKHIRYGNKRRDPDPKKDDDWAFHVLFDYGEHDLDDLKMEGPALWEVRPDAFSSYRAGFEIRTYRLCKRVLMLHAFPQLGATPTLVSSLDFEYRDSSGTIDPSLAKLVSVTQQGYQRNGAQRYDRASLPATEFAYTPVAPGSAARPVTLHGTRPNPVPGVPSPGLWTDAFGEGIPGLLAPSTPFWFYKPNFGEAQIGGGAAPRNDQSVRVPDAFGTVQGLDGDGPRPLVRIKDLQVAGVQLKQVDNLWDPYVAYTTAPDPSDPNAPAPKPITDADVRPDVFVAAGDSIRWARRTSGPDFDEVRAAGSFREEDSGTELIFIDDHVAIFLADMTGDGLSDVARVRTDPERPDRLEVAYWPNLGSDSQGEKVFGAKIVMGNPPRLSDFAPKRVRLADVDRSGTADLVYLAADGIRLFRNLAGNSFDDPPAIPAPTEFANVDNVESVQVVDLLGEGTCCLVWANPPNARDSTVQFIALTGDVKPHLLNRCKNNMGMESRVEYAPSTRFYLDDAKAGKPWISRLPMPVMVVAKIEVEDKLSGTTLTSTLSYHHGYYDAKDRELRGFGRIDLRDAETIAKGPDAKLAQAPTITKTWFHTGEFVEGRLASRFYAALGEWSPTDPHPPDSQLPSGLSTDEKREAHRALKGMALRCETRADDGTPQAPNPFSVVEYSYRLVKVQPSKGKTPAVFRADLVETLDTVHERKLGFDDPRLTHSLVLEIDDFGNPLESASVAYARWKPQQPEQARPLLLLAKRTVVNDAGARDHYRLGAVVEAREFELSGIAPSGPVWTAEDLLAAEKRIGSDTPFEAAPSGKPERRLLGARRVLYSSDDLEQALSFGAIGTRAKVHHTLAAAFTPGLLKNVYGGRVLDTQINQLLGDGKYQLIDGVWWTPSATVTYDADQFFLPVRTTDPFGGVFKTEYDPFRLLATAGEDAIGNRAHAELDYRVMLARQVTDANGNQFAVEFDARGAVVATATMGKAGAKEGDTLQSPTTTIDYDPFAFQKSGAPCFVVTRARERHCDPNARQQASFTYYDGLGRTLQTKMLAEPASGGAGERWVGSGAVLYNNKGSATKTFQPFFSNTSSYEANPSQSGAPIAMTYDPIGRLIRVDQPDGSFETAVYEAWGITRGDRNDNVLASDWFKKRQALSDGDPDRQAAAGAKRHDGTTARQELDPFGRAFLAVADNGGGSKLATRTRLDVVGLARAVIDPLGREAMRTDFDLLGRALHTSGMEAGARWTFYAADGLPLALWDSRSNNLITSYDSVRRPLTTTLNGNRQVLRTVYGESQQHPEQNNLRGRPFQIFDGLGVSTNERYDFKGNLVRASAQFAENYRDVPNWLQDAKLGDRKFATVTTFDALDRAVSTQLPDGTIVNQTFNAAGLLERLDATLAARGASPQQPATFIKRVDYNQLGQRTHVEWGNGTASDYEYDPDVFRLTRLTTQGAAGALQALRYTYDPVGNITRVEDGSQQTIYFRNQRIDANADYGYDAIYRLTSATGREHLGQVGGAPAAPGNSDEPRVASDPFKRLLHPSDGNAMGRYQEQYSYDDAGNLSKVTHKGLDPANPGWTRVYDYKEASLLEPGKHSNRLSSTAVGNDAPAHYRYDEHGNTNAMPHLSSMVWDYSDHLQQTSTQIGSRVETTYYCYDATGARVRKVTERADGTKKEERFYLHGLEVHRTYKADGTLDVERETINAAGVALVETRTAGTDGTEARLVRFQLGNHLGSSALELSDDGKIISYEEYYPYGSTSYQAVRSQTETPKRYRYTGSERDEESGLYYNGLRYYAPWLGRWTACDPLGTVDGPNLYRYCRDNPIDLSDPSGCEPPDAGPDATAGPQPCKPGVVATGQEDPDDPDSTIWTCNICLTYPDAENRANEEQAQRNQCAKVFTLMGVAQKWQRMKLIALVELAMAPVTVVTAPWDIGVAGGEAITGEKSGLGVHDNLFGRGDAGRKMSSDERAMAGVTAVIGFASFGFGLWAERVAAAGEVVAEVSSDTRAVTNVVQTVETKPQVATYPGELAAIDRSPPTGVRLPRTTAAEGAGGSTVVSGHVRGGDGLKNYAVDSLAHSAEIGHTSRRVPWDFLDGKKTSGIVSASHAERQAYMQTWAEHISVSKEPCLNCRDFFRAAAEARGGPIRISGPNVTWVFGPPGSGYMEPTFSFYMRQGVHPWFSPW